MSMCRHVPLYVGMFARMHVGRYEYIYIYVSLYVREWGGYWVG